LVSEFATHPRVVAIRRRREAREYTAAMETVEQVREARRERERSRSGSADAGRGATPPRRPSFQPDGPNDLTPRG
jgi:hypothetical protein